MIMAFSDSSGMLSCGDPGHDCVSLHCAGNLASLHPTLQFWASLDAAQCAFPEEKLN